MTNNPLRKLRACGQSVWNDNISRDWIANGGLKQLVDEDGIGGVTSNPTIFDKAIGGSSEYDDQLRKLAEAGDDPETIFKKVAAEDIAAAADILRPVYDRENALDGYVSIEVSPAAAHDTVKTLEDAHWFWENIHRPNIMIKVPATPEGMPAVEQLISEGINVNITLIFAVEVYEQVMESYIKGLERRVADGKPIDKVASVASFFVSRVDTLVDGLIDKKAKGADPDLTRELNDLRAKAAIANAKIAYERFQQIFSSERFQALKAKGAQVQRPLWASTSTKNPDLPDTMYVTTLVGEDTVNTMPPKTIDAVRDHGDVECGTVTQDVQAAHEVVKRLAAVGINMTEVTDQLTVEGVESFCKSLNELFDTIGKKSARVAAGTGG